MAFVVDAACPFPSEEQRKSANRQDSAGRRLLMRIPFSAERDRLPRSSKRQPGSSVIRLSLSPPECAPTLVGHLWGVGACAHSSWSPLSFFACRAAKALRRL